MKAVAIWFEKNKQEYPWRINTNPYRVWVSEVMLQQTRALVVVPYFNRWMEKFPSIEALSQADEKDVIKAWEGLGYYSRARNLHSGAKEVVEKYGGVLPKQVSCLLTIKGIGPYTAGAIAAFAYKQRCAFVDGNIARVMARYFAFEECIIKGKQKVAQLLEANLPQDNVPGLMEGLIELGQQVCKKKPNCSLCPLSRDCQAFKQGRQEELPRRELKHEVIKIERQVALIRCGESILLKKNEKGKLMADLFEFPYISCDENRSVCDLITHFPLDLELEYTMLPISHSFTKYKATLFPYLFNTKEQKKVDGLEWVEFRDLDQLPFSSGHKRIKEKLLCDYLPLSC